MSDTSGAGTALAEPTLTPGQTAGFALSMFLLGSFFLSLSPVLPDVARDLGADGRHLGYPGGAYGLSLATASLGLAPFQDMLPRRAMLYAGITAHFSGLTMVALAPDWPAFVLAHGICGLGAGLFMPAAYAAVSDRTVAARRASVLGYVNSGWAASTLMGVPAAAFLAGMFGWRTMVLALAATWPMILILTARLFQADPRNAAAAEPAPGFWSRAILVRMTAQRLPWLFASTVLVFVGFYGVYAYLGIAIRRGLGVEAPTAGIFVSVYGLGFLTGTLNGWVIDRVGPERSLCIATAILGVVLGSLPFAASAFVPLGAAMFLWGVFQNAAFTSFTSVLGKVEAGLRGRAFSINTACVFMGSSIGTAAMGVVNSAAGFTAVGILCMIATAAASLIATLKVQPKRRAEEVAP